MTYHVPVLLQQCIESLEIRPDGTYVDVTFGGGGHAIEIYKKLKNGHLIAFDQDPDVRENVDRFKSDDDRSFTFVPYNFSYLKRYLEFHAVIAVDGILADLGVSSFQIDSPQRGFSTRYDGRLDMRMDKKREVTAWKVVNEYSEENLVHLFSAYGEIRNSKTLAHQITKARSERVIDNTDQLNEIASPLAPKGKRMKYLSQLYQAIRIEVNDELNSLKEMLTQAVDLLKNEGRLVVISYHSLEDRIVKDFMKTGNFKGIPEKDFYGNLIRPLKPLGSKPLVPSAGQVEENSRARSAKLRVAIKQ